jgi:phosphoglycolate phosphatase
MIKEIIFDFDGTIADSFEIIVNVFAKNKEKFGWEKFGDEEIKMYREKGIGELLKKSKVSIFKISKAIKEGLGQITEQMTSISPFEGIKDVLLKLKKRGLVLGIMSTNGEENIQKFLKHNEIEVFDYVVGKGSLFGKSGIIKSILKKRKLNKDEVLYVGDEVRDIEACRKLGIKIIAVTWGFNDEKLLVKNKPDYLIKNPRDFLKILKSN